MALSRTHDIACAQLSEILANYLALSGGFFWKLKRCFQAVANRVGLEHLWIGGSNSVVACRALLEATLDRKPEKFAELVTEIVKTGIKYREKKKNPVGVAEINRISELCLEAGAYVKDLRKPDFLAKLVQDAHETPLSSSLKVRATPVAPDSSLATHLASLKSQLGRSEAIVELAQWLGEVFPAMDIAMQMPFAKSSGHVEGVVTLGDEDIPVKAFANVAPLDARDVLAYVDELEAPPRDSAGIIFCFGSLCEGTEDKLIRCGQKSAFVILDSDFDLVFQKRITLNDLLTKKLEALRSTGRVWLAASEIVWG